MGQKRHKFFIIIFETSSNEKWQIIFSYSTAIKLDF